MSKEVAILGGGVAGLSAATKLAENGERVTIFQPDREPSFRSVYTTFKQESAGMKECFLDIVKPLDYFCLLTAQSEMQMSGRGYWMIDYPAAIALLSGRLPKGVRVEKIPSRVFDLRVTDGDHRVKVGVDGSEMEFEALIDCSGDAAVTREGENYVEEYVFGGVFAGDLARAEMTIAIVKEIGATCWVNPSILGEEYVDVVLSGWGWRNYFTRFKGEGDARLRILCQFLEERGKVRFREMKPVAKFSGMIGSQGMYKPKFKKIYAAGDAAGMARPTTGDGFRWAVIGGEMAAQAVSEGLNPDEFYRQWRRFRQGGKDDLFTGAIVSRMGNQRRGELGGVTEELSRLIKRHPFLKEPAEEFAVSGGMDPKLLFYILTNQKLTTLLFRSALKQAEFYLKGVDRMKPFYPFPPVRE